MVVGGVGRGVWQGVGRDVLPHARPRLQVPVPRGGRVAAVTSQVAAAAVEVPGLVPRPRPRGGEAAGAVGGQLAQVLLLGDLCPLLVVALGLGVQAVPQPRHHLAHLAEAHVGVAALDAGLPVPEEERVGGHRLLRLVRVPLLLPPRGFRLLHRGG